MGNKILVVDDDIDILNILALILDEEGYDLILRQTGIESEEIALLNPDLILLDVRIAGFPKSGLDICTQIKATAIINDIPVVLVSSEYGLERLAKECGADGFVCKPFQIDELVNKVREFVS